MLHYKIKSQHTRIIKAAQKISTQQHSITKLGETAVCVSVDFAGGCTGAAGQVSHWVTRARSFASGSFPRPRGAPHCDLPIKLHMCQRTLNPSESSIHVSLYVVAVLIAGNKLWQTHNITEREQRKWLMLFVYHTVRCAHTNGHIAWKCVSALGGKKMVLSLKLFSTAGWDWWQQDYWSSRRWNQDKVELWTVWGRRLPTSRTLRSTPFHIGSL